MSVFNHLKNLIRQGKSAVSTPSSDSSSDLSNATRSLVGSNPTQKQASRVEAAARMVEEEREAKKRIPTYAGLERYKLLCKMGDGAFSDVYKAVDVNTLQKVAVKVVRKYELSPIQRASIVKEVQIMRNLKHTSIVQLLGFIDTKEHYFLILELCEGGELFHRVVHLTYFSETLSRHCIVQVAKGIHYLHEEKGIVHRDIKPENLLFDKISFRDRTVPLPPAHPDDEDKEDEGEFIEGVGGGGIGKVKIADFGLSKVIWDKQTATPCGTVGYTAPEIVRDERYSKSVDMWALGCVLYTLLCGFPPFYDESIQVLTQKVARGEFEFLSPWWDDISSDAKDLISHLLTVDPEERYTIVQFLDHPWIKNEQPVSRAKESVVSETKVPTKVEPMADTASIGTLKMTPLSPEKLTECSRALPRPSQAVAKSATNIVDQPADTDIRPLVASPTITSMKEVFDVSYAVHRMAEETARRKALAAAHPNGQPAAVSAIHAMNNIDEDEDDDTYGLTTDNSDSSQSADSGEESDQAISEPAHVEMTNNIKLQMDNLRLKNPPTQRLQQSQRERVAANLKGSASPKPVIDRVSTKSPSKKKAAPFELKMGSATLLEKRKQRQQMPDIASVKG
ncbi:kinase-like domain-containing protein [Umbelopsis sp. AD052]|nr:kinase-like domain-containing protein [Umbelopsis sp. AD052]